MSDRNDVIVVFVQLYQDMTSTLQLMHFQACIKWCAFSYICNTKTGYFLCVVRMSTSITRPKRYNVILVVSFCLARVLIAVNGGYLFSGSFENF